MPNRYRVAQPVLGFPVSALIKEDDRGVAWLCVEQPHLTPEIVAALVAQGILTPLPDQPSALRRSHRSAPLPDPALRLMK